jgi:MinD-like ATPase involved in chromosome partitioning or flagellar assembly
MTGRTPVLVAAAGADWEADAIESLGRSRSAVLQKRCVDLPDLLASAGTGLAGAALVDEGLPGLDADSVDTLTRAGAAVLVVARRGADAERLARMGAVRVLAPDELDDLGRLVTDVSAPAEPEGPEVPAVGEPDPLPEAGGRLLLVWGPAGAPGRTTVAVGLAAEAAARGRDVLLLDADPYAGAVAQHLGVLDEVSGLLAAARLANAGDLDATRLAGVAREAAPGLRVLTGLPRADRWAEVRPAGWAEVLEASVSLAGLVVVDGGFSLEDQEDDFSPGPRRNGTTLGALEQADAVVVVGSADPVGLARLARGLVELRERAPATPLHVVVNRMRPSLGWSEREVAGMVEGFVGPVDTRFLPEDRPGADRALMAGRSLVESGESALRNAMAALADEVLGERAAPGRRRRRVVGLRRRAQAPNSR